jgi:tyrosyl-tRNA synthetase
MLYNADKLKEALKFNTLEIIPSEKNALDTEIQNLIKRSAELDKPIRHYIGFEISGEIHIGTGIMSALKIKKLQEANVECTIFLADYHTWLNNKLDGNIDTIRQVSKEYFAPLMLQCCKIVGCDVEKIKIVYAEELYNSKKDDLSYWTYDMAVSKTLSLSRVLKSTSITGKEAGEGVEFSLLRYPVMQVTDAFFMDTQIVHAGMDQRKCHVLMREVAGKLKNILPTAENEFVKPIAVHHDLLLGLLEPKMSLDDEEKFYEMSKMSKSIPDSCIFVYDSEDAISRKLKKAYCPTVSKNNSDQANNHILKQNPLLNWSKKMIFPAGKSIKIERKKEWGGDIEYFDYSTLEKDYIENTLHPLDLKQGVAACLIDWFEPLRAWAESNESQIEYLKNVTKKN